MRELALRTVGEILRSAARSAAPARLIGALLGSVVENASVLTVASILERLFASAELYPSHLSIVPQDYTRVNT